MILHQVFPRSDIVCNACHPNPLPCLPHLPTSASYWLATLMPFILKYMFRAACDSSLKTSFTD